MMRHPPDLRTRAVGAVLDEGRSAVIVAGELGVSASTVRRWVARVRDERRGRWWSVQVEPVFDFLADLGFALVDVHASDWWEIRATYRAEQAALIVVYSLEFQRVEVRLIRAALLDLPSLSNGRAFLFGVPGMGGHLADGLLTQREPQRKLRLRIIQRYGGLEPERVAAALRFWADVVLDCATDYLHGDLSVLDQWEHRPDRLCVTVNVPRSAAASEEARIVQRVRQVLPDADLVVQRYPRPAPSLAPQLANALART
jgi:hypothetical protein